MHSQEANQIYLVELALRHEKLDDNAKSKEVLE